MRVGRRGRMVDHLPELEAGQRCWQRVEIDVRALLSSDCASFLIPASRRANSTSDHLSRRPEPEFNEDSATARRSSLATAEAKNSGLAKATERCAVHHSHSTRAASSITGIPCSLASFWHTNHIGWDPYKCATTMASTPL